jgi:hypothetical protein
MQAPRALLLATVLAALGAVSLPACDDDVGPDIGPGGACGGRAGGTCAADQYCDFGNNLCGADDTTGRCMPRPASCPALLVPERTCGCDGRVYSSACEVTLAGADLSQAGACPLDPGAFACGYRQCSRTTEYCLASPSDVPDDAPDSFACRGLPPGCGSSPSCACLSGQTCGNRCTGDAAAGFTLSCLAG